MSLIGSLIGRRKFLTAAVVTSTAALFRGTANAVPSKASGTMDESMEKRMAALEEANKKLEREVTRARDIQEIQNMVGLMQQYHTDFMDTKSAEFFAKKAKDLRVYFPGGGYWEGPEAPYQMGKVFNAINGGKPPLGHLAMHIMGNCVIEIAEDGQSAQGVWHACGIVASTDAKTKKPSAMWEWNRYGDDFVKEDGKWCFRRHHIYPLFQIGWDEKWSEHFAPKETQTATEGGVVGGGMPALNVDGPPGPLDQGYDPLGNLPYIPLPHPYATYDLKDAY
jgi:hypothetical protein